MRTPAPNAIVSPSGRNPIGRRRARRPPSRSEEAAINPQASASPIQTPYVHSPFPLLSSWEVPTHYGIMSCYRLGSQCLFTVLPREPVCEIGISSSLGFHGWPKRWEETLFRCIQLPNVLDLETL